MTNCYKYLAGNKLMRSSDYPYTGQVGSCQYNAAKGVVNVASYREIAKGDINSILNAVAQQPVSAGMAGYCGSFMLYKGGVITTNCGTLLNHAVLIVGYGRDAASGMDYWIIKNSWGTAWGEGGFFRLKRTTGDGLSGINNAVSYPIL